MLGIQRIMYLKKIRFSVLCVLACSTLSVWGQGLDEAQTRTKWELQRLADPLTGTIPDNIRFKELRFFHEHHLPQANPVAIEGTPWMHRGPFHVGGRTRGAAVDVANEKRLVAGGVSGGLWLSEDQGNTWKLTQEAWEISSISCLVQDTRKGHQHVWYAGTGEAYGQSASKSGAYYYGNGLLVSSDSGKSWSPMASTQATSNTSFNTPWQLVWNVVVDTTRYDSTIIYAATYQNIMRSNDAGLTWTVVRRSNGYFNEVYIDGQGTVYSTSSSESFTGQKGLFYSTDGWNWNEITPSEWQGKTYRRVVLGIRPSLPNENFIRLYAILNTDNWGKSFPDSRGEIEWNAMHVLEVSVGANKQILRSENLSQNLPNSVYVLNSWRTQGSYDMVVGVFPPKENEKDIVFIGGTNLFRSLSGFEDSVHTDIIGGYKRNTALPNFEMWPNQHPDQHVWMFFPSNPNKVLNGNDGGLFLTENCLADSIVWKSLNHGYLTTQFYTVALDPSTLMSPLIVVGAQDNNQMLANDFSPEAEWDIAYPGDGSYCAIEPGADYAYFSKQLGNTLRVKLGKDGKVIAKRRIDPIGVKRNDYQFINPFLLDPSSRDILYMAAGRHIFRNNQLSEIPLDGSTDTLSFGWSKSLDSLRVITQKISALGMSAKISERPESPLYIGTNVKFLYAIDSPSSGAMRFRALKTPPILGNANVSCIAVHPDKPEELVVTYSNYGVYSMFQSVDGGENWEKIGGNLEDNENGTGEGPSIRWFKYVPVDDGMLYLVGTSIGLFASDKLEGVNTKWVHQAPGEIGNAVVDMIDYRPLDGTVAVATHGRGIFYARLFQKGAILERDEKEIQKVKLAPNPTKDWVYFLGEIPTSTVKIYSLEGRYIASADGAKGEINLRTLGLASGTYILIFNTPSGNQWQRLSLD